MERLEGQASAGHVRVVLRRIGHPGIHSKRNGTRPRSRTVSIDSRSGHTRPQRGERPNRPGDGANYGPGTATRWLDGGRPRGYRLASMSAARSYRSHLPCRSWARRRTGMTLRSEKPTAVRVSHLQLLVDLANGQDQSTADLELFA